MKTSVRFLCSILFYSLSLGAFCACKAAGKDESVLIDIGGRKLKARIAGHGSPTVVIESGMAYPGASGGEWNRVVEEISKTHQVVVYDRAGLGGSDPARSLPRTCRDVADDLDSLLSKAGLTGPFLLVGHSYGGMHIRMFASQHPEKVSGMVLVDSTHPDQEARWLAALPPVSPEEPESITGARRHLAGRTAPSSNPEQIDPAASSDQVRAARGLGGKPLVLLSHSADFRLDPRLPEAVSLKLEKVCVELQKEMKGLSSNSRLLQSAKGGHILHVDDPGLVIKGIRLALDAAKNQSNL